MASLAESRGGRVATFALAWFGATPLVSADVVSNGQVMPAILDGPSVAVGGQLVIGDDTWGEVSIGSGGSLRSAGITLGRQTGGQGGLELRGTGAIADSLDDVTIGRAGEGELRLLDHARLTTGPASDLVIAGQAGSEGRLVIDGHATADLGGHGFVSAWHPPSPGRPTVSLDQGAILRFALGNPAGVAAEQVGSLAVGHAGTATATLSAAGHGTLLDVPGVWSLGHAAAGDAELFDGATADVGELRLGVASPGSLRLDGATLRADTLRAGLAPHAPATLAADEHATIHLGAGGLRLGPIPGAGVAEPVAAARVTARGTLISQGPIDLGGTADRDGHRFDLLGPDASLATAGELRLGGPTRDDRATLRLDDSHAAARSAAVEPGGTLTGRGTLALDQQLAVAGTVRVSGGVLNVDAERLSRFFPDATLAVGFAVVPLDDDDLPETPPIPTIAHGTLRFADDARLDGTLELEPGLNFPNLPLADLPAYEPFVLAETDGVFTGWFDRLVTPLVSIDDALAVIQTDTAVLAQRARLGDANLDRRVDQHDLNAVLTNWGGSTDTRQLDWSHGDFNGDGRIEQADLNAVLNGWGSTSPPASAFGAVPEPTAAGVLLGGLALTSRRKRPAFQKNLRVLRVPR
ncbi:MAG: dockerin type I domain-containing protein [Planctomycetota bacterium]